MLRTPNRNRIIHDAALLTHTEGRPIVYVDIGARGALAQPWRDLPKGSLRVIGFEPDAAECERLNRLHAPHAIYLPTAVWSEPGNVPIHLAATPTCSSVHPPNFPLIQGYEARNWESRVTRSTETMPAQTLDVALAQRPGAADFIKIDTQGAEYEILCGAKETLEREALAVLVETWTMEVHQGQRLTQDVLSRMADTPLRLHDVGIAAAWKRKNVESHPLRGKSQIVGLDLLFLREPATLGATRRPIEKSVKLAAIAEVYGYPDLALEALDAAEEHGGDRAGLDGLRTLILARWRKRGRLVEFLRRRAERCLGLETRDYPRLHQ